MQIHIFCLDQNGLPQHVAQRVTRAECLFCNLKGGIVNGTISMNYDPSFQRRFNVKLRNEYELMNIKSLVLSAWIIPALLCLWSHHVEIALNSKHILGESQYFTHLNEGHKRGYIISLAFSIIHDEVVWGRDEIYPDSWTSHSAKPSPSRTSLVQVMGPAAISTGWASATGEFFLCHWWLLQLTSMALDALGTSYFWGKTW